MNNNKQIIKIVGGDTMERQIMVLRNGTKPSNSQMEEISGYGRKPSGGIWTSSEVNNGQSGWSLWCASEMPEWIKNRSRYALVVKKDARILEIASAEDLMAMYVKYKGGSDFGDMFDWNKISKDYDGVHLTEEGQWNTRFTKPVDLYGWDMESTVWFRWVFESVVKLEEWDKEEIYEYEEPAAPSVLEQLVEHTRTYICRYKGFCTDKLAGRACSRFEVVASFERNGGSADSLHCPSEDEEYTD